MAAVLYGSGSAVGGLRIAICCPYRGHACPDLVMSAVTSRDQRRHASTLAKHGTSIAHPRIQLDARLKGRRERGAARRGSSAVPCRAVGVGTLAAPRQLLGGVRPAGKSSGSVTHLSHHARPGRIPAAQSLASHHDRTRAGCRRWRWRWMADVHRAQAQAGPEESCHPMTAASSRRKSLAQCCTERE